MSTPIDKPASSDLVGGSCTCSGTARPGEPIKFDSSRCPIHSARIPAGGYELTPGAKPYSPYHGCKKCGAASTSIAAKHVTFGYICGADMIRRTCGRCGYVWDERPLDRSAP